MESSLKTNRGLFEPTVMFFGMCNSPVTFQAMMDNIFRDMINHCIVIIYMDDIFLFAPDKRTLTENTKKVLTHLRDNDLFLKPTKCKFNQTKVEYLGLVLEEGRISMDPGKLKGIRDWPTPYNSQANLRIFRIWELLPMIHLAFFGAGKTTE